MKPYLYSLICAGIISALIGAVFHTKDGIGKLVQMMCGLFMVLVVLAPIKNIHLSDLNIFDAFQTDQSAQIILQGQSEAQQALQEVIKEHCCTYIVEKAKGMGVDIDVQFELNDANPPIPDSVTITGAVSPYEKTRLKAILTQDLGIPEEKQRWK